MSKDIKKTQNDLQKSQKQDNSALQKNYKNDTSQSQTKNDKNPTLETEEKNNLNKESSFNKKDANEIRKENEKSPFEDNENVEIPDNNNSDKKQILENLIKKQHERKLRFEKEKEKAKKKLILTRNILIIIGIVALIYFAGVILFFNFTYPNTYIGDSNISFINNDLIQERLNTNSSEYKLEITGENLSFSVDGPSINYSFNSEDVKNKVLKKKNPYLWPIQIFQTRDFQNIAVVSYDESALSREITAKIEEHNVSAVQPINATLNVDGVNKTVTVTPETKGNTFNIEAVFNYAKSYVSTSKSKLQVSDDCQILPLLVSNDARMTQAVNNAKIYLNTVISFKMGGVPAGSINSTNFGPWMELNSDYSIILNQKSLYSWTTSMSSTYNTVGKNRTITTPYGKTITLSSNTGWAIDKDALASEVSQKITTGTECSCDIPCSSTFGTYVAPGRDEVGSRYIAIDLSTQHVRMYDNNNLIWESDCVSGAPKTPTNVGFFKIGWMQSPSILRADDGSYNAPVSYWMQFDGGIGFHDATWQSAFGGNRWKEGYGSHGCINLPLGAAGSLYNLVHVGDIVIVHN